MPHSTDGPDATQAWRMALREMLGDPQAAAAFDHARASVLAASAQGSSAPLPEIMARIVAQAVERLDASGVAELARHLHPPAAAPRPEGFRVTSGHLPPLDAQGVPGISLVSCCKNRNANLVQALRSWLPHAAISEIVLVDWSSAEPVAETLAKAGLSDPRIRILRVEGEGRWILTHAFNAGFRAASCRHILKADADIVIAPDFFAANPLPEDAFVAGNWRVAGGAQAHVNGFFLVPRAALAAVGGFNEHIRSYGWDDEDLYDRLVLAGFRRIDVAPGTVTHLLHDDALRLGSPAPTVAASVGEAAMAEPPFHIRQNRFVAALMPPWQATSAQAPFEILDATADCLTLKRLARDPSAVPAHVLADARRYALTEILSWRTGADLLALDPGDVQELAALPVGSLTRLDVLLARKGRMDVVRRPGRYLLLRCDDAVLESEEPATLAVLTDLVLRAERAGTRPVFLSRAGSLPPALRAAVGDVPVLEPGSSIGPVTNVMRRLLYENRLPETEGVPLIAVASDVIDRMALLARRHPLPAAPADPAPQPQPAARPGHQSPAAPQVAPARPARLFIDAQHGLGNRLRAIASAAAIAAATGRELVVVWEPDAHCDCRLSDLFDYRGAVVEERFLDRAAQEGQRVFNYMAHEPGAEKDAPIVLPDGVDVYARSAFLLQHPASTWTRENAFLRSLVPVAAVQDLVASVRPRNDVAVHVRMEGGKGVEHLPYESRDNWTPEDHALIGFWRGKSQPEAFARRLDTLLAEGDVRTVFLAADRPEAYDAFAQRYRGKLAWLPRTLYDRSADQLRHALADAILLSKAPRLLASSWSSFSELATRLAPQKQVVELSGRDF